MVLSRDSNAGHGAEATTSQYRQIDIFDITGATDIKGKTYDCATCGMDDIIWSVQALRQSANSLRRCGLVRRRPEYGHHTR